MFADDKKRFTQWVKQYQTFLYRAAWTLSGERELAKDLVQETFALAWRARKQLRDESATQAWLYRILRREVIRSWRDREPWDVWDDALCARVAESHAPHDAQTDLLYALRQLSPIHRDVLVPFYLADMSYEQLAATLNIPIGTVMSRLSRARSALRQLLDEEKTS